MLSNQAITDIVLEHMDASRPKVPATTPLSPAIALKYIRLIEECAYRDAGTMSDKFARLSTKIENRFIERYM